jgi:hypothetical protein
MNLFLVLTDDNYSWIGEVYPMPNNYWEQYRLGLGHNPKNDPYWYKRKLYEWKVGSRDGVMHRGPSYLFDVDVWNWKNNFEETTFIYYEFSRWYKQYRRDNLLNEII